MELTEDEARQKRCPFSRIETAILYAHDRLDVENNYKCCASDCMAWRWNLITRDEGYCGLAGKPKQ
jgi:hypothetical protein